MALHLVGWLWLLGVALAFWQLWQAFGAGEGALASAGWARAAAFFMAAIGAGPILLYLTIERTRLLSSQTHTDGQRRVAEAFARAVEQLGHAEIAVRQGGIHALGSLAKDSREERTKVMHILAAYLRDGSQRYVEDAIAAFREAEGPDGSAEARRRRDCLLKWAREALEGAQGGRDPQAAKLKKVLWMVQGVKDGKPIKERRITAELLPALAMPIDLEAAVTVIRCRLSLKEQGSRARRAALNEEDALNMAGVRLYGANFNGADFRRANFVGTRLYEGSLVGTDFSGALLTGASIRNTGLDSTLLRDADLRGVDLRGSALYSTNLRNALMHRANLAGVLLWSADLREAHMTKAKLRGARFHDCQLQRAILHGADLREALFQQTRLHKADLTKANLAHARMEGVDLFGANLQDARLDGADLRGARHLTQEQIDQAKGNAETRLPKGVVRPLHWGQEADGWSRP